MKTTSRIILGTSILINILLGLFLWKGPKITGSEFDEQAYRDSINILRKERLESEHRMDSLNRSNDSLVNLKTQVKTRYYEKVKFIYTASPAELDSIIRQLTGLRQH